MPRQLPPDRQSYLTVHFAITAQDYRRCQIAAQMRHEPIDQAMRHALHLGLDALVDDAAMPADPPQPQLRPPPPLDWRERTAAVLPERISDLAHSIKPVLPWKRA